ncbi:hypothetical protein STEG23_026021, partial [Scotinomys teguina]
MLEVQKPYSLLHVNGTMESVAKTKKPSESKSLSEPLVQSVSYTIYYSSICYHTSCQTCDADVRKKRKVFFGSVKVTVHLWLAVY